MERQEQVFFDEMSTLLYEANSRLSILEMILAERRTMDERESNGVFCLVYDVREGVTKCEEKLDEQRKERIKGAPHDRVPDHHIAAAVDRQPAPAP